MHPSVMAWVRQQAHARSLNDLAVLEIGSYDVNGSVREIFTGPYLGVDYRAGPGVDLVADARWLPIPSASWPVVVSTEMLEHCEHPDLALAEMERVLVLGGCLLLSARGPGFPPHDYPHDYHRFSVSDMKDLLCMAGFDYWTVEEDPGAPGVLAYARS